MSEAKLLATVDQWRASIETKVAAHLKPMSNDMLMSVESIIRSDARRFVEMAPEGKKEFLGLCAYLAIANELKRRIETEHP